MNSAACAGAPACPAPPSIELAGENARYGGSMGRRQRAVGPCRPLSISHRPQFLHTSKLLLSKPAPLVTNGFRKPSRCKGDESQTKKPAIPRQTSLIQDGRRPRFLVLERSTPELTRVRNSSGRAPTFRAPHRRSPSLVRSGPTLESCRLSLLESIFFNRVLA